jgi:hypothetical protein
MSDVGLSLASLASIFARKGANHLPDHLRLQGDTITFKEIVTLFQDADPERKDLKLECLPVAKFEQDLKSEREPVHVRIRQCSLPLAATALERDPAFVSAGASPSANLGRRQWIRLTAGKGLLDHSVLPPVESFAGLEGEGLQGTTELRAYVNDGSLWQWRTVQEYAESVKGRPWC